MAGCECGAGAPDSLRLVCLSSNSLTCNDGSPAGLRQECVLHGLGPSGMPYTRLVQAFRGSLKNVRAIFALACIAQGSLARPEWLAINVSGVPLPKAIYRWEKRFSSANRKERARCAPQRLVERCSWPQYSSFCPRLRDPRTGEEVALASVFGLDVRGAVAAMGLDARALSRMSCAELLPL